MENEIPVNEEQIRKVNEMCVKDAFLSSALRRLISGLLFSDIMFPSYLLEKKEEVRRRVMEEFWIPVAETLVMDDLKKKFFAYQFTPRKIVYEKGRLVLQQTKETRGPDVVVVPIVPDPSTYVAYVGLKPTGEAYMRCEPVDEESNVKIHVLWHATNMPDPETGNLRSPLVSLLAPWESVEVYDTCEMQAVYANTHTPVVYQYSPPKNLGDMQPTIEAPSGVDLALDNQVATETLKIFYNRKESAETDVKERISQMYSTATKTVGLKTAMQGDVHVVPLDMTLAPNVPKPMVPTGLETRREAYRQSVCGVLGVPASYINNTVQKQASSYAEIDSSHFVSTLQSLSQRMSAYLEQIYMQAMGAYRPIEIPFFVPQSVDRLVQLHETGLLDDETMKEAVFKMTGFRPKRIKHQETPS